jgi:hypothetical protein
MGQNGEIVDRLWIIAFVIGRVWRTLWGLAYQKGAF